MLLKIIIIITINASCVIVLSCFYFLTDSQTQHGHWHSWRRTQQTKPRCTGTASNCSSWTRFRCCINIESNFFRSSGDDAENNSFSTHRKTLWSEKSHLGIQNQCVYVLDKIIPLSCNVYSLTLHRSFVHEVVFQALTVL